MEDLVITIDEESELSIEKYYFEYTGNKIRLLQFIEENEFSISQEAFDRAYNEYIDSYFLYTASLNYVISCYVDQSITSLINEVMVDFENNEITIILKK